MSMAHCPQSERACSSTEKGRTVGADVLKGRGEERECRVQVGGALVLALSIQGNGHVKVQQCSTCGGGGGGGH